jgi:repressor LexA
MKKKVLVSRSEARKNAIFEYLKTAERNGVIPSVREICEGVGIPSASTVHSYLKKLEAEGKVSSLPNGKKTVRLIARTQSRGVFPLVSGTACNGDFFHPSKIISTLTSDEGYGNDLFGLVQTSSCLLERGIINGDVLICKRVSTVKEGDIAVYEKDGRLTAAIFSVMGGSFLMSTDDEEETLYEIKIYGKVVGLRRSLESDE